MSIKFKSIDFFKSEIFIDDFFIGHAVQDISTQKWKIKPSFSLPYNFSDAKNKNYFSCYEAGKELARLYLFIFPEPNEDVQKNYGFTLDEILSYLKMRE